MRNPKYLVRKLKYESTEVYLSQAYPPCSTGEVFSKSPPARCFPSFYAKARKRSVLPARDVVFLGTRGRLISILPADL